MRAPVLILVCTAFATAQDFGALAKATLALKAALEAMLNTGPRLREVKGLLGNGFDRWVTTQLPFDVAEAELFIHFSDTSGIKPEALSPAVEVKLPRLLDLLAQLIAVSERNAEKVRPVSHATTGSTGKSRSDTRSG